MKEILDEVAYLNWHFILTQDQAGKPYLQVAFTARDIVSGESCTQKGRKWKLSWYMTRSEIVYTAFKAVLTAVEHETRESFRYKNRTIFSPHFDVDKLVEFAGEADNIDMRTGVWVA